MSAGFIDYYEVLEISPNANSGTIERMFRYLAQCHHPDNPDTGDRLRFDAIMEAHAVLKDPLKRVQYDIEYKSHSNARTKLVEEVRDGKGLAQGIAVQNKVLSLLYVKCRQNVRDPGIGEFELERLSGCPAEHLEFHIWYLKEKGWIRKTENGTLAITVEGVDRASTEYQRESTRKLLSDQSPS